MKNILFFIYITVWSIFNFNISYSAFPLQKEGHKKERLNLKAKKIDFINNKEGNRKIEAKGEVEATYASYNLFCDFLSLDEMKDEMRAGGKILLKEGKGGQVTAEAITSSKDFTRIKGNDIIFEKNKIFSQAKNFTKEGEFYYLRNAVFSTCAKIKQGKAPWQVRSKKIKYDFVREKLFFYNTILYAGKVPLAWIPYFTIQPYRNYGFLAPEASTSNGQYAITTPYFISEPSRTHYFVFSPQIYFNNTQPENQSRVSNYSATYTYNKNSDMIALNGKFAPKAYNETNNIDIIKENRWNLEASSLFQYKKGNYGIKYQNISDISFRRMYNFTIENYLTNKGYINYFSDNGRHFVNLESMKFIPIAFSDIGQTLVIEGLGNHIYGIKLGEGEYKSHTSFVAFTNRQDMYHKRISNSTEASFKKVFPLSEKNDIFFTSTVTPEIRFDYYLKSYRYASQVKNNKVNESYIRAVPSFLIANSIPVNFHLKTNRSLKLQLEPMMNISFVRENLNNGKIVNEDSAVNFVNSVNIMNKSYIAGYDLIDTGLTLAYGIKFRAEHAFKQIGLSFFAGQREKFYFIEKKQPDSSNYAGKVDLFISPAFKVGSDFIFSRDNEIRYASNYINLIVGSFKLNYTHTFIDKSLLRTVEDKEVFADSNESRYEVRMQLPETPYSIGLAAVQNHTFLTQENNPKSAVSRTTYFEGNLLYTTDCIQYEAGYRKNRLTNLAIENTDGIYIRVRLITI